MTQAKHTPGPWEYTGGTRTCEKVLCTGGRVVADTWWCRGSEESEANARLIAAAPKMYELLKRYRNETPLGNQPHMIASDVDDLLLQIEGV